MAKQKNNKLPLGILILIYAVLFFASYNSLTTLALGIWGQTVMGTVDSYDTRLNDTNAGVNRSRIISKGYYFTVNGKEYRGYVIYASDESWPRLKEGETRSERISYFSFFSYINKPAALADFSQMGEVAIIYHILSPIGCLFLLLLVTGTFKRKKKSKKAAKKVVAPQNKDLRRDLNMFCQNCGSKLSVDAAFCSNCGAKAQQGNTNSCVDCGTEIPQDAAFCINCGIAVNSGETSSSQTRSFAPQDIGDTQRTSLVGFSDRCNSSEILDAARKNRKSSIGCMWILVFVPLIGFLIAGLLMDDFPFGESVVIGIGIALLMLMANLYCLHRAKQPMWEGVVTNKFSKEKYEHKDDASKTYMEYTVAITTDAGRKKTIVEKDSRRDMYDYLDVGDKVRFHPKFGSYEKYDKSKDRIIYCNVCSMMNPIENDRCKRCNNLLFK